jgi:CHAD domain-containing protein
LKDSDVRTDLRFDGGLTIAELAACLPQDLCLEADKTTEQTLGVCDTFNGLIWQSGCVLVQTEGGELQLWQKRDQPLAVSTAGPGARFWWQLPQGDLTEKLKKIIDIHAFTPKFRFGLTTHFLNILNSDQKIVTRIRLFHIAFTKDPALCLATFLPLRGYTADYQRSMEGLAGLKKETVPNLTLRQLLIECRRQVEIPITKPVFHLQAQELAEPAILRMAQGLLRTARQYEPGLLADIDTEFVHQYRVNIRKTRSLISLFKKALSPRRYQQLKVELKMLASRTNRLRDLDVFLLEKENYPQMLPPALRPGLEQVFRRARRHRATALKQVTTALGHPDYEMQVKNILLELEGDPEFATSQATTPLKQLVSSKGLNLYGKICRDGQALTTDTPDEKIHALRISMKKLRYLLELFAELLPKPELKHLVGDLKKLQDNLGRFNDFAVQAEFLHSLASGRISSAQAASLHGLSAVLYHQKCRERARLLKNITALSSPAVSAQLFALFSEKSGEDVLS